jgi:chromosomal replication initiator protein
VLDDVFTLRFEPGTGPGGRHPPPDPTAETLAAYIGDGEAALVRVAVEDALALDPLYRPLVFVGPPGVGKSLLARGLAARLSQRAPAGEVLFYSGAAFSRSCGLAADTNSFPEFRQRLNSAAAILMDDLQQIAGKSLAQEELRHALDRAEERGQPIIATLRNYPLETKGLCPALAGRLSGGLTVPLRPPGPAAGRQIVRRLARQAKLELTDAAVDFLVQPMAAFRNGSLQPPTVPQYARAINRLAQLHDGQALDGQALDDCLVRKLLGDIWAAGQPELRAICSAVARYFDQRPEDLRGAARRKELVHARAIAMYLARQLTTKSLGQVGRHFGNRDHTTVMHACRRTQRFIDDDGSVRKAVEELVSQFIQQ